MWSVASLFPRGGVACSASIFIQALRLAPCRMGKSFATLLRQVLRGRWARVRGSGAFGLLGGRVCGSVSSRLGSLRGWLARWRGCGEIHSGTAAERSSLPLTRYAKRGVGPRFVGCEGRSFTETCRRRLRLFGLRASGLLRSRGRRRLRRCLRVGLLGRGRYSPPNGISFFRRSGLGG